MTAIVLLAFVGALVAPAVVRVAGRASGWALAVLPFSLLVYFVAAMPAIGAGETLIAGLSWAPGLGADLQFRLDGLGLLFALLITGIGTLVVIYAGAYLAGHRDLGRFYLWLLLFLASMLGLVLADNLIALFVFWELTSITSFFLIGFTHEQLSSRKAALQALLVTGGGGLALLAGLIMLGLAGGSFELSTLLQQSLAGHPLYLPILLLVFAGAFTKSAQVPFHFWLPSAMEAPTPVSAYLHSATMVKAGIYLLARLSPVLGGTSEWTLIASTVGALTMVTGGVLALFQSDLKRILAYSTVSALGALTMMLGLGTRGAVEAAMVFLLAHALYKGALFLIAGAVDHETGTRNVAVLGGLRRLMPITAAAAVLAGVSLAGLGPVLSFIGKERLLEAALEAEIGGGLLAGAAVLGGVLFVVVAALVAYKPFFGPEGHTPKHAHEAPLAMYLGPVLLAFLGLLFGLLPVGPAETIVGTAAGATLGRFEPVHLTLWHGINLPLALSALSFVAGVGLFLALPRVLGFSGVADRIFALGPERWYDAWFAGLNALARGQTRLLQSGYLRVYLSIIFITTLVLVTPSLAEHEFRFTGERIGLWHLTDLLPAALIVVAAFGAARARTRIGAVALLGAAGIGVALIYVIYGAPDLAITQVLVETLTVILFVLVFFRLPPFATLSSPAARFRDAVLATAVGALMTVLLLQANEIPRPSHLSDYFAATSYPEAHGRNIVNVILVDFRGLDTMGEITVLALAGIGVYALLRLRPEGERR